MNYSKKMFLLLLINSIISATFAMDMRTAWLEFPHNKKDANGNTFWHNLAIQSENMEDWSQASEQIQSFLQNNNQWNPNPLLTNNNNKTARKEAKDAYNRSGNPVSGLLVIYLSKLEKEFLNKTALKDNRELMNHAQYFNQEAAKNLNLDQLRMFMQQLSINKK